MCSSFIFVYLNGHCKFSFLSSVGMEYCRWKRNAVKPLDFQQHTLSPFKLLDVGFHFQGDGICFRKLILFSFKLEYLSIAAYPALFSKIFITKDVEILMSFPENLDSLKANSVLYNLAIALVSYHRNP